MRYDQFNNNQATNSSCYTSRNKQSANFVGKSKNVVVTQTAVDEKNNLTRQKKKKNKSQELAKVITTFATMVSATIACVVGIETIFPTGPTITAEYFETWAGETEISYSLFVEDYDESYDNVYVVLYNDFTNRSQKLDSSEASGTFENLKKDMTYTIELKQGDNVVVSKNLRTGRNKSDYGDIEYESDNPNGTNGG